MKSLPLLNRVFRVGVDQTGQNLDIEPDLRHAAGQSGVRRKTESDSGRTMKQHDTDLLV